MNDLCMMIKNTVRPNFGNMRIALRKYDRDALFCGSPCWRWAYHAIHSADKWFIDPSDYAEPDFHEPGMDDPYAPCMKVLSDEQLMEYLDRVERKTLCYLDTLTDEMLYGKPGNCKFTRLELVLKQYRHFMCHVGMLNGQTGAVTGEFPGWVSDDDR